MPIRNEIEEEPVDFASFFVIPDKKVTKKDEKKNLAVKEEQCLKLNKDDNSTDINKGICNNIVITSLEVQKNKQLELVETLGNFLGGRRVYINASGMVDGLRNKRDGSTLFGRLKYDNNKNHINDFILNMNQINESVNTVFKIQFDRDEQQYYLTYETPKDESSVLFVHLDRKFMLKKKQTIISLEEMYVSVNIDNNKHLLLIIAYQKEKTKMRIFSKDNFKLVRIGRGTENEIVLRNNVYSKVHTSFTFDDKVGEWFVQDGIDGKASTNGTWLYLDDCKWIIEKSIKFCVGSSLMSLNVMN